MTTQRAREVTLPRLLRIATEDLMGTASWLQVMAVGRREAELLALSRAANRITRLGSSLERLARERTT